VDTLVVALRTVEKTESQIRHIHPVIVREDRPRLATIDGQG
jgi:hypothetical protein